MSKIKFFFFFVFTAGLFFPGFFANADGMILPPLDYEVRETGQKAVIFHENGKETLILTINFKGDAKDFGWVIPTPKKPKVTKGSDEIFTSLEKIVGAQKESSYRYDPLTISSSVDSGVTVIETKKISYYDIAVLAANDSEALAKWLSENNYNYPEEYSYLLNEYINNKWYFVAVKISPEAEGASEVVSGLKEGQPIPLKIEFNSQSIIYPLKISQIKGENTTIVKLSDSLILNKDRIDHLKIIGYEDLTDKEKGSKIINKISQELLAGKKYSKSQASKYSLMIFEGNYYKASCYSLDSCREAVESWFNNYFSEKGLYYDSADYIPVNLYIIADGKKTIPEFTIGYANWISDQEIEKLAYGVNGDSLINPAGKKSFFGSKKYYLTYLQRSMLSQEMTEDLIARDAKDNKRVNALSPWVNFGFGILITIGGVLVFSFLPFGFIFATATLFRKFSKSERVKIVSKIFQIFFIIPTALLFIFFLIITNGGFLDASGKLWTTSLSVSLGIILIFEMITLLKQSKFESAGEIKKVRNS